MIRVEVISFKIASPELKKRKEKERCNRIKYVVINDRPSYLEEHGTIAIGARRFLIFERELGFSNPFNGNIHVQFLFLCII